MNKRVLTLQAAANKCFRGSIAYFAFVVVFTYSHTDKILLI